MSQQIRVDLAPQRIELRPGESASVAVALRNISDVVQHLVVEVVGLPAGATFRAVPELVKLLPGGSADADVTVTIPETPPALAGAHVLGVLVRSSHGDDASRCEELVLTVLPAPALASSVQPTLVTGGRTATFLATLSNDGNTPLPVELSGTDAEQQVALSFAPASVLLRPGQSAQARIRAQAPRAWTGQDVRRSITIRADAEGVGGELPVTFVQRPRLSPVAVRTGGMVVAALLVAGTAYAVRTATADSGQPGIDAAPTAAASPTVGDGQTPGPSPEPTASAAPAPAEETEVPATASPPEEPSPAPSPTLAPSPPTAAPPTSAPTSAGPAPPPGPVTVDLTGLDGGPAARLLPGNALASGVVLGGGGLPVRGPCAVATRAAAHGTAPQTFVTAAREDDPAACMAAPVLVRLPRDADPVSRAELTLVQPGSYVVRLETVGGASVPAQRATAGRDGRLEVAAPEGEALSAVVVGRADVPSAGDVVGLRQVVLVPAG